MPNVLRRALLWALALLIAAASCTDLEAPALSSDEAEVLATGPAGTVMIVPIGRRSTWAYSDLGVDQGTAWRTQSGGWASGHGPLGYGESYLATTLSFGNNSSTKHPTTYFRSLFFVPSNPVRKLYLRVMYDDGFVFYINGHEGGRANMPAGPVGYTTRATSHEAENRYVTFDISSQIPHLQTSNQLAIEVHQDTAHSSDLVFDAELVAWIDPPYPTGPGDDIARGDYWSFWDSTTAPPAGWRAPGFADAGWSKAPGPLGFGENYVVGDVAPGPITHSFRRTFRNEGSVTGLIGELMYDDGAVIYLNGHEVARPKMPGGAITASTLGFDHEANATYDRFDWSSATPWLVPGINTIAVEVHQASTTSSDLVFDLSLHLEGAWHQQPSGSGEDLRDVVFTDATHGWTVGTAGTILRTTDGGGSWTSQPSGTTATLTAIQFADPSHAFIVGDAGTILASSDAGATWQSRSAGASPDFEDLTFLDASTGWIVAGADLYRTGDGGTTWTHLPTGLDGTFNAVRFTDPQHGWIAGAVAVPGDSHAALYGTSDGGLTWSQQWISGVHHFYLWGLELVGGDTATAWAVGQGSLSGVGEKKLVTHDGGATWTMAPATSNDVAMYDAELLDGNLGWAVGFDGSIVHTADGGATWAVQQVYTSYQIPDLRAVSFVDGNLGWAVGDDGYITHTTTGGN